MKTFLMLAFLAAALAAPIAHSDDAHHPEGAAGKAPRTAPAPRVDEKSIKQMQDHMAKMQELMAKMQKTTDPAERQKLMDEHMKSMREGMSMMRGMGGPMMGMMGGKGGGPMMNMDPKQREDLMQRRMDMMQMMMEQMMRHDQMTESMPAK